MAPLLLGGGAGADRQPAPRWPVLDKAAVLARQRWWDNRDWRWYDANIPFFESPDTAIDATYYYRWQLITRHLTYGSPQSGYTFSEFIDRPFWSGTFGAISCPVGHQMYELRWLKDRRVVKDFAHYWFDTPGAQPRSYSNWYGDAVWATYLVNGDRAYLRSLLPDMEQQYAGWMAERWDSTRQMFHWDGLHDGMEENINSRLTTDPGSGADGYRPTLNSYLYADARAIANAAALFGDSAASREFSARAASLKAHVEAQLWDPTRDFFFHQFAHDEKDGIIAGSLTYRSGPYAGNPHGREEIGYVPWQFELPDSGYASAWRFLMDTAYFAAPFGPTTVERHDPQFEIADRCCVWSGNEWPYATSQTLVAMANLLDDYHQRVVTRADYDRLFETYTRDQRKAGRPYIAENANPDNGSWRSGDTFDHSEDYFHSEYVNLVITGVVGLRPRADDSVEVAPLAPDGWRYFALDDVAYHGHELAIVWDRDGTRYGYGAGLSIIADGRVIGHSPTLTRLVAFLGPARQLPPPPRPVDLAVNNGRTAFPVVAASYTAPGTAASNLVDGNYWYNTDPPNRWTTDRLAAPRRFGDNRLRRPACARFGATLHSRRLHRRARAGVVPACRLAQPRVAASCWRASHSGPARRTSRQHRVVRAGECFTVAGGAAAAARCGGGHDRSRGVGQRIARRLLLRPRRRPTLPGVPGRRRRSPRATTASPRSTTWWWHSAATRATAGRRTARRTRLIGSNWTCRRRSWCRGSSSTSGATVAAPGRRSATRCSTGVARIGSTREYCRRCRWCRRSRRRIP